MQHLAAFRRVHDFRMELDRIESAFFIFHRSDRTVCRMCSHLKTVRNLCNIVRMAHPHARLRRDTRKDRRVSPVDQKIRVAVLTDRCRRDPASQKVRHELGPIADPEDRNTQGE